MFELTVPPGVRSECQGPRDRRWTLWAAILGSSLAFLDSTVVNVALPIIQNELDASIAQAQWIVEAYALAVSSLVLVGGGLGDRFGRRRVFLVGVALFALASAACAACPNASTLVLARAVQGGGAALLIPGSLSLLSAAYPEDERGSAIGTWSAFSAVTASIGPVAGGWIVGHVSWRWLFLLNIPVSVVVVWITREHVRETRDEHAPQSMDWLGATLTVCGLGLILVGLIGTDRPESNGRLLAEVGGGFGLLAIFLLVEARTPHPMVPLSLFRSRTFSGANLLTFLLYAALGGILFFVPFNLIQVRHYPPAFAGASLLPLVVLVSTMSRWSGKLAERGATRALLILGPLLTGAGFLLLAAGGRSYWSAFFPGITVIGFGMGLTVAPLTTTVMGSVSSRHLGIASGVNNAVSRAGGLLAVAALGLVLIGRFNRDLDRGLAGLALPGEVLQTVRAQRAKLGAADLSTVRDAHARDAVESVIAHAYLSGFRDVAIVGAALAGLSSIAAWGLIGRPSSL